MNNEYFNFCPQRPKMIQKTGGESESEGANGQKKSQAGGLALRRFRNTGIPESRNTEMVEQRIPE